MSFHDRGDYDDDEYGDEASGMEEAHEIRRESETSEQIKSFLGKWAWLLLIVIGFGWYGLNRLHKQNVEKAKQDYFAAVKTHKADFIRKDAEVRMLQDPMNYLSQRRALMEWYFQGLEKIHKDFSGHPEFYAVDAVLKEAKDNLSRQVPAQELPPDFEKAYALVKEMFTTLKEGKYSIVSSDVKEGMRLDFYRMSRQNVDGNEKLKADFFLWGVVGDRKYGSIYIDMLNENGNMFAALTGSGAPYLVVESPESKVKEFPPGMVFGFYAFDLLSPGTSFLSLRFDYEAMSPNGVWGNWTFEFQKIPVERTWCAAEGELWDKEMEKMLEEDIEKSGKTREEFMKERVKAAIEEADRLAEETKKQEEEQLKEEAKQQKKGGVKKEDPSTKYPGYK